MRTKDIVLPDGMKSIKDVNVPSRTITAYISSWHTDSGGDRFLPGAWKKSIKERGPKGANRVAVLYMHLYYELLSKPFEVIEDDFGLLFRYRMHRTRRGDDTMILYEEGVITEHSVGYDLVDGKFSENEFGGLDIKEAVLWEGSPVTWGMNQHTPTVSVKGLNWHSALARIAEQMQGAERALRNGTWQTDDVPEMLEQQVRQWRTMLAEINPDGEKGATSYQHLPLAAEDRTWDANAAKKRVAQWAGGPDKAEVDWTKYRMAFLWFNSLNAQEFGAYKLPIADVISGELKAVPKGIYAAAGAVQGARRGANIPDADVPTVKRHIEKYYERLDRTPPWKNTGALDADEPGDDHTHRGDEPLQGKMNELYSALVAANEG